MSTKDWSIAYWHYMPGASSPMQMMKGAMKCMQCGEVKEGETVLISTDTNKLRIAEALGGAAYAVGATPIIIMIPPVGVHGGSCRNPSSRPSGRRMSSCSPPPGRRPTPRRGSRRSRREDGAAQCAR